MLPLEEVLLWLKHLRTIDNNRKHGAAKAAQARSKKRQVVPSHSQSERKVEVPSEYYCGKCGAYMGMEMMNTELVVMGVGYGFMEFV